MKKINTAERIKFSGFRRRSVGGPRGDADSDVTAEQLVSDLMDTTPSSSFEGRTWQEGYVYNPHDTSVAGSPLILYDSDGEAADEVVTGTQEVGVKADLIVKEDVPEITGDSGEGSLLARGLAAVKVSQSGQGGTAPGSRQRDDTFSDAESLMGDPRLDPSATGCTAQQLMTSLMGECKALGLDVFATQETDKYVLRMADDDWDPDLDFPGLDSSAVITDVGVDQFVLCQQGEIKAILLINIALHKGLNGPLTGTGAMEAPGAGASVTLEVDFQIPGRENGSEDAHHLSMPIDNGQQDALRYRDSGLRSNAASAAASDFDEFMRASGSGGREKESNPGEPKEEAVKLRNNDTGEDIALAEIEARVPPSLDPGEVFKSNDVAM